MTIVMICATILIGDVLPETLHYDDCSTFEWTLSIVLEQFEVSPPDCAILEQDGFVNYYAVYLGDYYDSNNHDDISKVAFAIEAAGAVSSRTTWHSDYVFVVFENKVFSVPTSTAREYSELLTKGSSLEEAVQFLLPHIRIQDIQESSIPMFDYYHSKGSLVDISSTRFDSRVYSRRCMSIGI